MKIVSLLGSPRAKGNSATIAKRIVETAVKLGAETVTYELNRLAYQGCQGCYACKKGLEECVLQDDLAEVLAAVREADCVVLASGVYFGEITSQLKGFFDRCFSYFKPDFHTNPEPSRLKPKKLVFVITQGNPDEAAFDSIFSRYDMFLKWLGFKDTRLVRICGIGPATVDGVPETALRQAEDAARVLMS
ncbi:MAG: flavodoxin family protein [Geobacteraceae bacterium]|nr:flavodoxin family protein [Geobacteraceae bacterium]